MKPIQLGKWFEEIAQPNEEGVSRIVTMEELITYHPDFKTKNGLTWARDTSWLGKKYLIQTTRQGGATATIQLMGFNLNPEAHQISNQIRKEIVSRRCVVLDISTNIECDHKNGRYDEQRMHRLEQQTLDDYQPLNRNVNLAKRRHCKECREQQFRYDAKRLGYGVSYIKGDATSETCEGCYWYDPFVFNQTVTQHLLNADKSLFELSDDLSTFKR